MIKDLEEMELDVTFVNIQKMGKQKWKNIVRNMIILKSFKKLVETKQMHSKVKNIKHVRLEIQDYFMPNIENMKKEDVQMIFKIRCRNLNLKMNMKSQYDSYECLVCLKEDETQEHVYVCEEISKYQSIVNSETPKYQQILNGTVNEKLKVARMMKEKLKIREEKPS